MSICESHIHATHSCRPDLTPAAFADLRDSRGQNSYDVLAQQVPVNEDLTVLDLGCGDGHLIPKILDRVSPDSRVIGLDMVQEGLKLARSRFVDPRVEFVWARAQAMPLADQSVDIILSHMALMLMSPLEQVASEIRRVLKPGGQLVVVVSGTGGSGFYAELRRLLSIFVDMHIPGYRRPSQDRFAMVAESEEREFHFRGGLDGLWTYLESFYFWTLFHSSVRQELKEEIKSLALGHLDPSGQIGFSVPVRFNRYRI